MICSSVCLLRFIVWSFLKARLQFILDQFNGATSTGSLDPRSKFLKFIPGANGCRLPALGYVYDCINRLGSNPQLANACLPCCKVRGEASNAPDHVPGGYNRCNCAGGDALSFTYGHFSNSDRELGGHRSRLG